MAAISVAVRTFRKLESFLQQLSGTKLVRFNRREILRLQDDIWMRNGSLSKEETETISCFMKIAFGIGPVKICYLAAINLYRKLTNILHLKLNHHIDSNKTRGDFVKV